MAEASGVTSGDPAQAELPPWHRRQAAPPHAKADHLSALDPEMLAAIHALVFEAGGLPGALALEASSKKLRLLLREYTRLPQALTLRGKAIATGARAKRFWAFLSSHGPRVDSLALESVGLGDMRALGANARSVARVPTLSVAITRAVSLAPLAGLPNLHHLSCERLDIPLGQSTRSPPFSLAPLETLPSLQSLALGDPRSSATPASLAPLASLTALTRLQLSHMRAFRTLDFLPPLAPSLRSLLLDSHGALATLDPLASLTNLTSLTLARLSVADARGTLAPLAALGGLLRLRCVALRDPPAAASDLDLAPVGDLGSLQSLALDGCHVGDARPIAALRDTLQELRVVRCRVEDAARLGAAVGALRALTALDLGHPPCSSLAFLWPLRSLRRLDVACGSDAAADCLQPLGALTALQQLKVAAFAAGVGSLEPLGRLGELRALHLLQLPGVRGVEPLAALTALESLRLESCWAISSLEPLRALTRGALRSVQVVDCHLLRQEEVNQMNMNWV